MKKYGPLGLLVLCYCLLFIACNTTSPENYFDVAVLNSNMQVGFANEGFSRQFESPSVKMGKDGQPVPMMRSEIINDKIKFLETNFKKLKGLKETGDTRAILQNAVTLYEYVLPVYKTEYVQLAKLYDTKAPKEAITLQQQYIHDKYFQRFEQLYNSLISNGKVYAAAHNIKVNWAVNQ